MSTVAELTTKLTVTECQEAIYSTLAARGGKPTTWKPGAVTRTIVYGFAIIASALSALVALLARSAFLDLSSGAWLTLVARYVYGVERLEGSFATGEVTLTNAGAGVYSGDADDLIFVNTSTGVEYRNTEAYSLAAFGTATIAIQAVELGTDSNAAVGEVAEMSTPLIGVTCSNADALIGTDPETNEALRVRCREKLGSLSPNGPRDAYSYVAKTTLRADDSEIGVTRVKTVADGVGGVDVYIADGDGSVLPADVALIQTAIEEQVAPLGVTPTVQSAAALSIAVTYELWVPQTSLSDAQLEEAIEDYLGEWLAAMPIGGLTLTGDPNGRVYVSAIEAAISQAVRDAAEVVPLRVVVTIPATYTDVGAAEAPVIGAVTVTGIHQIAEGA